MSFALIPIRWSCTLSVARRFSVLPEPSEPSEALDEKELDVLSSDDPSSAFAAPGCGIDM
eukprot:CAMPEP_0119488902 /NCGR_PEP_ID=MMETSP1344-20130328/14528_1 /TAXON_ID=236787 /ORGANISM="Florenciella parvula, Strain CCMP2471" /LENGTH=59 /DNA_ID=CAMNT_0007523895 /DNA_START=293 /DNA_END=472 /DNA_ORIENTATION=+